MKTRKKITEFGLHRCYDIIYFAGYMNKLLSCRFLIPFSRTTYCAYLVHPIIIRYVVMKRDTPLHLTVETVVRTRIKVVLLLLLAWDSSSLATPEMQKSVKERNHYYPVTNSLSDFAQQPESYFRLTSDSCSRSNQTVVVANRNIRCFIKYFSFLSDVRGKN